MTLDRTLEDLRQDVAIAIDESARINALCSLATALEQQGKYSESYASAEEVFTIGEKIGDYYSQAEGLRLQGLATMRQGAYKKALTLFQRSLKIFNVSNNTAGIGRVTGSIGVVYAGLSDYSQALKNMSVALQIYEGLEDYTGIARVAGNIGNVYQNLADYPQALQHYNRALTIYENISDRAGIARVKGNIGGIYQNIAHYSQALEFMNASLALHKELGNRIGEAAAMGSIGNVYLSLLDFHQALRYYQHSLDLHEQVNDHVAVAGLMGNIGTVFQNLADYPQALEHYRKALLLHEKLHDYAGVARINGNIGTVYQNLADYPKALSHLMMALKTHEQIHDRAMLATVTGNIGVVFDSLADYSQALEYYSQSAALLEEIGDKGRMAHVIGNIGTVYQNLANYPQALFYFNQSLGLYQELGDRTGVARVTGNIGNVFKHLEDYTQALQHYQQALATYQQNNDRAGIALITGNIGVVHLNLKNYQQALENFTNALVLNQQLGDRAGVAGVMGNLGIAFAKKEFSGYDPVKAEEYLLKAATLNSELGTKHDLYANHQDLADLYDQEGDITKAYQHYKNYHQIEREVLSEKAQQQAMILEHHRAISEMEQRTAAERERAKTTEELLYKTLPPSIADRMIAGEQSIADRFDSVSILFSDLVGFTPISAQIPASTVLEFINFLFARFDAIAAIYGCERIKTIGDGYLAVCGAPIQCQDHAERIARMAIEMLEEIKLPEHVAQHLPLGTELHIRIGLHSGSITAGVIGTGKLAYDIYGDAVNIASRMESHGEPGKIHVSQEFAEALFGTLHPSSVPSPITNHQVPITLEERGVMEIKGKGQLRTYFLSQTTA